MYTGEEIAKKGVVYVTINYRVGIFGFLAYEDATGEQVDGNFAFLDMIAALEWVKHNIAAFGGDPDNVTLAGQSAGSTDIQTLDSSPAAGGLFDHAVMMSANMIDSQVTPGCSGSCSSRTTTATSSHRSATSPLPPTRRRSWRPSARSSSRTTRLTLPRRTSSTRSTASTSTR